MTAPLNILRFGEAGGAPVFLIHGFTGDAQRWVLVEEALTREYPMIAVEMPNHGASPKHGVTSFDALLAEVTEAFDGLDLTRAHIVGHSLGGAVAIGLAAARPESCASLTLLAPAGLGRRANVEALAGLCTATRAEDLRRFLQMLVHDPALISDAFVELAVEIRADPALRTAQDEMREVLFPGGDVRFDMRPVLQRLTLPTQIIWGKEDGILPVEDAKAAPDHMAVHLFDNMGHIPQIEAPDAVAALMLGHFRAADAS